MRAGSSTNSKVGYRQRSKASLSSLSGFYSLPRGSVVADPVGTIQLPDGWRIERSGNEPGELWVPLEEMGHLGIDVKGLGEGRIGLCPTSEVCIAVPDGATRGGAVDLAALEGPLGLLIADDGCRGAIRSSPQGPQGAKAALISPGDAPDLELPDLDGRWRSIGDLPGRLAVFSWASW